MKTLCASIILLSVMVAYTGAQSWTQISIKYQQSCMVKDKPTRWTLCGLFYVQQYAPSPDGGPQALEGYVELTHEGHVDLAMGTIGNIEQAGTGSVNRAIALTGGIVVSGPGQINEAIALSLSPTRRKGGYSGVINVKNQIYISFDNGWTIRPDGADLILCSPRNICRSF